MTVRGEGPIFILGMSRRSGTNYLWDLLRVHPDVGWRSPIWEDHLVQNSAHLFEYVDSLRRSWNPEWEVPDSAGAELLRRLGQGITAFLDAGQEADGALRIATKTPSIENLERFHDLLPDSPLLVVVRDGRSVAESMVKSGFSRTYEAAMRDWSAAARRVLAFDAEGEGSARRYRIVRYEDLVTSLRTEMTEILSFCGLAVDAYDFDRAARLPVRGSSTLRSEEGEEAVHWAPRDKPADFRPEQRWEAWNTRLHRRFRRLAGEEHAALGYEFADLGSARALDVLWTWGGNVVWVAHRFHRAVRRRRARKAKAGRKG